MKMLVFSFIVLLAGAVNMLQASSQISLSTCPPDWKEFNNNCYYHGTSSTPITWHDAVKECGNMNSMLTSIDSSQEQQFIKEELINNHFENTWFGLNDIDEEGNWKNVDGTPVGYTQWGEYQGEEEPNNKPPGENCAALWWHYDHRWNDYNCNNNDDPSFDVNNYICRKPIISCLPDWKEFNGNCYYHGTSSTSITWHDAVKECGNKNSMLTSIDSSQEQQFIKEELINNRVNTWFGLNDIDEEGNWKNVDGTPVGYTQWGAYQGEEEPNNKPPGENCAALWWHYGHLWNDYNCNNNDNPSFDVYDYICRKPITNSILSVGVIARNQPDS